MRVCLVAPLHASKFRGYGVERFAYEIQQGLTGMGVDVETISAPRRLGPYESSRAVRILGLAFEGFELLRRSRNCNVIHFAEPVLVLMSRVVGRGVPKVTTVHEVPDESLSGASGVFGTMVMRIAVKRSELILADSSITKAELIQRYKVSSDRVQVVNLGVGAEFKPAVGKRESEVKTVGYVGGISRKKNLETLLEAFGLLRRRHPLVKVRLEIWGTYTSYAAHLHEAIGPELKGDVRFMGFVPEIALPAVYQSFDVFVFPSLKEGFGLPILEAKRCGVPTILLDYAKISDEMKLGSVLAADAGDMAEELYKLLTDAKYSRRVKETAFDCTSRFTWTRTASETRFAYERVLG